MKFIKVQKIGSIISFFSMIFTVCGFYFGWQNSLWGASATICFVSTFFMIFGSLYAATQPNSNTWNEAYGISMALLGTAIVAYATINGSSMKVIMMMLAFWAISSVLSFVVYWGIIPNFSPPKKLILG